jgi:hypothetical protein
MSKTQRLALLNELAIISYDQERILYASPMHRRSYTYSDYYKGKIDLEIDMLALKESGRLYHKEYSPGLMGAMYSTDYLEKIEYILEFDMYADERDSTVLYKDPWVAGIVRQRMWLVAEYRRRIQQENDAIAEDAAAIIRVQEEQMRMVTYRENQRIQKEVKRKEQAAAVLQVAEYQKEQARKKARQLMKIQAVLLKERNDIVKLQRRL